jgi:uncharacterized membrane protein YhaH (DUF805 family)
MGVWAMFGFLFSPQGRVSRKGIWLFALASFGVQLAATVVDIASGMGAPGSGGPLAAVLALFLLWPSIAISIKRFHDRDMSGWWMLLPLGVLIGGFVLLMALGLGSVLASFSAASLDDPAAASGAMVGAGLLYLLVYLLVVIGVALFQIVQLYFLPGTSGPNRFGGDPRTPSFSADIDLEGGDVLKSLKAARPAAAPIAAPAVKRAPNRLPDPDWGFGKMHPARQR